MFIQPTEPRFLIPVLSLCNITVRYSALWGGPGPRFEPRTGSLEAGTLTTRPPHLHTTKEVWWSTSTIIRWFPSTEIQSNDDIYLHPWGMLSFVGINSRIVRHKKAQLFSSEVQDSLLPAKNLKVISEMSWIRIGKDPDLVAVSKSFFCQIRFQVWIFPKITWYWYRFC